MIRKTLRSLSHSFDTWMFGPAWAPLPERPRPRLWQEDEHDAPVPTLCRHVGGPWDGLEETREIFPEQWGVRIRQEATTLSDEDFPVVGEVPAGAVLSASALGTVATTLRHDYVLIPKVDHVVMVYRGTH